MAFATTNRLCDREGSKRGKCCQWSGESGSDRMRPITVNNLHGLCLAALGMCLRSLTPDQATSKDATPPMEVCGSQGRGYS